MNATNRIVLGLLAGVLLAGLTLGCAQNQESGQGLAARTEQASATPTTMVFNISHQNGPKTMGAITIYGLPGGKNAPTTLPAGDHLGDDEGEDGATTIASALPGFLNFNQVAKPWVDTSATGSTGGTASGAMTASQSPRADQKPEAAINIPLSLSLAPGARAASEATQSYGSGQATGGADSIDQSGEVTTIQARIQRIEELLALLSSLVGTTPPAVPVVEVPTTAPVE